MTGNAEQKIPGYSDGAQRNGDIALLPGAQATVTIVVDAPESGALHANIASAVGISVPTGRQVEADDPAHAFKLPEVLLPYTGGPGVFGYLGVALVLLLSATGVAIAAKRRV
ncbi:hypothetical protein [Corynebacterium cystitidis]|uniref:Uncharacterized protein n=1 Tax=Corynebacterium cystitidis DSM 20524 TaxID=1121357 RepID=A0A1H9VPK1_9CORY|nr:hypothetical protein [Corynebacterium cystitidis]WJY82865.1 hypothetical protein CCYS_09755 [Corynebacterium cystitidis DSM 20524]SES23481.1 hypothetical protein SAMN05661109_02338 [Corynebacterium cystitidis DSM 20524]SNV69633.1 Uncharacterised protein [Corynebacterium cystitidis]